MASHYQFIGVAPSGRLDGTTPYWLAAPSVDNYDITFFNNLLDRLEAQLCVNTRRVYATGMSNGAQMSSLSHVGCRIGSQRSHPSPASSSTTRVVADPSP